MFSFLVTLQRYEIIVIPQWKLTILTQFFLFVKNVNLLLNLIFFYYLYGRKNNTRIKKATLSDGLFLIALHHLLLGVSCRPCYIYQLPFLEHSHTRIAPTCD